MREGLGPGLVVRRAEPPNAETPLAEQRGLLTPTDRFYVRSNLPIPTEPPTALSVEGLVERPIPDLDLALFERRTLVATMECAGNGRAFLDPPVEGERWELGAVSTAEWQGVALADVLAAAGVQEPAVEVVFVGADGFRRSLPLADATNEDVLVATRMNGEPLPDLHGGPVRLLVPGWYGMASVKWLSAIAPVAEPFEGHFQVERYVVVGEPVREMAVRSVITEVTEAGVRGYAWTGRGVIDRVEVSRDGGRTWAPAQLAEVPARHRWVEWELAWEGQAAGGEVIARAADSAGRVQPLEQVWNRLGYGNNQARPATVFRDNR